MDMIKAKWNQLVGWWSKLNKKGKLFVAAAVIIVVVLALNA